MSKSNLENAKAQFQNTNEQSQETKNEEQQGVKKRRTKEEAGTRNFTCGCGKTYLSYPALYLHLKNKQYFYTNQNIIKKSNSQTPSGTQLPNSNSKGARGRPKVAYNILITYSYMQKEEGKQDDIKLETDYEIIKNILEFLQNIGGESLVLPEVLFFCKQHHIEDEQMNSFPGINLINIEMSDEHFQLLMKSFPSQLFQKQEDYQEIIDCLNLIHKNKGNIPQNETKYIPTNIFQNSKSQPENQLEAFQDNQQQQLINQNIRNYSCNMIFAFFLYQLGKFITPQCFLEIVFFIIHYRLALNQIGYQKIGSTTQFNDYCNEQNAENALEVCNEFITEFLPMACEITKSSGFKIIGNEKFNMKNSVFLTFYFTNWLFASNFTNSKLRITQDQINNSNNDFSNKTYMQH